MYREQYGELICILMFGCKGLTRHDLVFILTQFKKNVSLVNNYFSTLPVDVQVLFKEVSCIIGKKVVGILLLHI